MRTHIIKQEKQDNGLWGTPFNCFGIDKLAPFDKRKEILNSAAIALYDQIYNCKFEIINSTDNSFLFNSSYNTKHGIVSFLYKKYEVIGNTLYEFDDENEHNIFLRRQKLLHLENI